MAHPLSRIIDQLKREPSRTGSIVITVFGDAIVPRGGSVWLGTLLEFFQGLDIDAGVVRTAVSRLATDGWLTREKVGRNSFYRLAAKGRQTFEAATRHIYDPPASDWTGRFELLLIGNGDDREIARDALRNAGFGAPLPGVWVAPAGVPVPDEAAGAIRLEVSAEDDNGRRLLEASWPLARTADAYEKFMTMFAPLRAAIGRDALRNAGFGAPLPGVWVAPAGVPVPDEAAGAIRLEVSAEDDNGRRLLEASWPLARTADAYEKFMTMFAPLRAAIGRGTALSEADAFTARILLIHYYRRVVLRDPLLPESLLPGDWPGKAARMLCGEIYRAILAPSEQWLDVHGTNEKGALPPARKLLERRFET